MTSQRQVSLAFNGIQLTPTSNQLNGVSTKRHLLKVIARIFDPLGLFATIIIRARMLLQSIIKEASQEDSTLSASQIQLWALIATDFSNLPDQKIR